MTVSDLLEQPCNKPDNINKVVTNCQQLVPNLLTTCDKQCEVDKLVTRCEIFACVWGLPNNPNKTRKSNHLQRVFHKVEVTWG
jgi:hypothetical protein